MDSITNVLSMRKCSKGRYSYYEIVYEWEDILAQQLKIDINYISQFNVIINSFYANLYRFFHIYAKPIFFIKENRTQFYFQMSTSQYDFFLNKSEIVACVIDYFISNEEYSSFIKKHCNMKMILISSREVYEYLVQKKCPLNIAHFPLSLSDKWIFDDKTIYNKDFDVVLVGRININLLKWLAKYANCNKTIKILVTNDKIRNEIELLLSQEAKENLYFKNSDTREVYMSCIRKGKIMLYATPGMDEGSIRTNGWNQVTPRFLEGIASQCHMICRYEDNADTNWYNIHLFADSCNNYSQFKHEIEVGLSTEIDYKKYRDYLSNYVTSNRAKLLEKIMSKNV